METEQIPKQQRCFFLQSCINSIDGRDFTAEKSGSNAFEAMDNVEEAQESLILKDKDQRISTRKKLKDVNKLDISL